MNLYNYAVVYRPEDKKKSKLLASGVELANSQKALAMRLIGKLGKAYKNKLEEIDIVVVNFGNNYSYNPYPFYSVTNSAGGSLLATNTTTGTNNVSISNGTGSMSFVASDLISKQDEKYIK